MMFDTQVGFEFTQFCDGGTGILVFGQLAHPQHLGVAKD
jgi:hypothetical protein